MGDKTKRSKFSKFLGFKFRLGLFSAGSTLIKNVGITSFIIAGSVQSEQTYNVNTSSFINGVYLYKLSTSNASHSGRLVVNK